MASKTGLGLGASALVTVGVNSEQVALERDALLVAIALELYRRRTGSWPVDLEALVPDLMPAVPVDRFDGRPLRYRVIDGRPLVYSVGADRDDDGGRTPVDTRGRPERDLARIPKSGADGDLVLWPR